MSLDRRTVVHIARCTDRFGNFGQRHFFGQIATVGIMKMVHTRLPSPGSRQSRETGIEVEPPGTVRWTFYRTTERPCHKLPAKFLTVVTGHELTAAVARLRLIVKLSLKPRDVRNCLLSLTITPTVYSTCHIMDSSHILGYAGSRYFDESYSR